MFAEALALYGLIAVALLFFAIFSKKPVLGVFAGIITLFIAFSIQTTGLAFNCGSNTSITNPARGAWDSVIVAWLYLDEDHHIQPDETVNHNDGSVWGANWTSMGKINGAFGFDNTSSSINVSNSPSLNLTTEVTVLGWFKP